MINVHQCSSIITPKVLVLFVIQFWFPQHSDDYFQPFRVTLAPGGGGGGEDSHKKDLRALSKGTPKILFVGVA